GRAGGAHSLHRARARRRRQARARERAIGPEQAAPSRDAAGAGGGRGASLSWEVLSPALTVAGAVVIIALERLSPYDPRQKLLRKGLFTDLVMYGIVQSYALAYLIGAIVRALDAATRL